MMFKQNNYNPNTFVVSPFSIIYEEVGRGGQGNTNPSQGIVKLVFYACEK
jgi:hypothetical protein